MVHTTATRLLRGLARTRSECLRAARRRASTAFYLDSATTVFVAGDDAAAKKSAWLIRRVDVLRDAVTHDEIIPIHLSEKMMVADPQTKHVTYEVWIRHMRYMMNFDQTHDGIAPGK